MITFLLVTVIFVYPIGMVAWVAYWWDEWRCTDRGEAARMLLMAPIWVVPAAGLLLALLSEVIESARSAR